MGRRIIYTLLLIAAAAFLFAGCGEMALLQDIRERVEGPGGDGDAVVTDDGNEDDTTISISAVPGVTEPAIGETPVASITETDEYTGTVSWSPDDNSFAVGTVYTATVTLTAKSGYTMTGVAADFFTVSGATATNPADSGVVTAVFPATLSGNLIHINSDDPGGVAYGVWGDGSFIYLANGGGGIHSYKVE